MTQRRKLMLSIAGFYVFGIVALVVIFGFGHKNASFQIQNEFKLINWVNLGVFSINRAVVYLFLAAILTVGTMVWISRRMQARPNRVQTAVEVIFSLMRDNITRGNMDDSMAAKWFPFIGALFLFIWFCNLIGYLPLPTNSEEKFNLFGAHIPSFALYAATANISVPLVLALIVFVAFNWQGIRAQGPIGYVKSLIPAGVHGPILFLIAPLEVISTFMRLISLTIRLFANILAGPHDHPVHGRRAGGDPRAHVPGLVHAAGRDRRLPVRAGPGGHAPGLHLRDPRRHLPRWRGHSSLNTEGAELKVLTHIISFAAASTGVGAGLGIGIGGGLGAVGAGVGIGIIFGKVIEAVTRQPEMRDEITQHPVARLRAHRGGLLLWPGRGPALLRTQVDGARHRPPPRRAARS